MFFSWTRQHWAGRRIFSGISKRARLARTTPYIQLLGFRCVFVTLRHICAKNSVQITVYHMSRLNFFACKGTARAVQRFSAGVLGLEKTATRTLEFTRNSYSRSRDAKISSGKLRIGWLGDRCTRLSSQMYIYFVDQRKPKWQMLRSLSQSTQPDRVCELCRAL